MRKRIKAAPEPQRAPVARLSPTADFGLTELQAQERRDAGLINRPVESPTKSVRQIIAGNVFTYFNLIFVVLAVLLATVGAYTECTFLGVVLINTVIGTVQEINAKRKLDQLTLLTQPKVTVVRDGVTHPIATEKLVLDDVVEFVTGNQICADGTVLSGEVQVNESLVTGESDEVHKVPGDKLLSGSFIVSGICRARLDAVGADSFAAQLTLEAKQAKKKAARRHDSLAGPPAEDYRRGDYPHRRACSTGGRRRFSA